MGRMSVHKRTIIRQFADGRWHDRAELTAVTRLTDKWLQELRDDGFHVSEDDGKVLIVARRTPLR
jgi:hypothetical protein